MAVRIRLGVAELSGNSIFEFLGNEVLQPFSFFMHLVPGIVQAVVQEALQKPVMPKHFPGRGFSPPASGGRRGAFRTSGAGVAGRQDQPACGGDNAFRAQPRQAEGRGFGGLRVIRVTGDEPKPGVWGNDLGQFPRFRRNRQPAVSGRARASAPSRQRQRRHPRILLTIIQVENLTAPCPGDILRH